jgi:hypothetical protein
MQTQQVSPAAFKLTSVNPLISLFDHVTRIQQRELRPSDEEQRLIFRSKVTRALLQYIDRKVDESYGTPYHNRVRNIAYERIAPTSSVENLIIELRKRIFQIHNAKKKYTH